MQPEKHTQTNRYSINPDTVLHDDGMNDTKGISRRDFLKISALAGIGLALSGCGGSSSERSTRETESTTVPRFSPELRDALGETGIRTVESAFNDYYNRYGCPRNVINFDVADLSSETVENPDGSRVIVLEQAGAGYVNYDVEAITSGKDNVEAQRSIRDTTLHCLTHACQIEPTQLSQPIVLTDGTTVNAYQGMSLLVTLPDGTQTGFRAIEEGICEALAVKLDNEYTVSDFSYFQLGSLTISIMNTWSTPQEIAEMTQNNDVMGYIGLVRGKGNPTQQDLELVMSWYQRARVGEDLETIQDEIVQSRGR